MCDPILVTLMLLGSAGIFATKQRLEIEPILVVI